jgi:hypothetical protein
MAHQVFLGDVPRIPPGSDDNFKTILDWSRKYAKVRHVM